MYELECHDFFKPSLAYFLLKRRADPRALVDYNNQRIQWEREHQHIAANLAARNPKPMIPYHAWSRSYRRHWWRTLLRAR